MIAVAFQRGSPTGLPAGSEAPLLIMKLAGLCFFGQAGKIGARMSVIIP